MFLNEQHEAIREMTHQFAENEIRPIAGELDETERFPAEIYDQMAQLGLFGISTPEEYGGAGCDVLSYSIVMEELSRGYAAVADQCGLVELISTLLVQYGTDAQKQQYLPGLLQAKLRPAYGLTEPEAGSDLANVRTSAVRDGHGWVLNGSKIWINNAPICDFALVLARTDKDAGHRGMGIFIVERAYDGVKSGPKEHKMGQRASLVGELEFDNVRLPADAMLGPENRGFHIMMSVLEKGRVGIGSLAVGIMQGALDASLEYAGVRKQFGQAIGEFQGVQWMLADMAKDITAGRLLVQNAATRMDAGLSATVESSMAKCFASDAAVQHTSNAVQIFGGSGYIRGFEVERLYRDAKITQIYEGTNQIQRMIIARNLLKG
ncbi:MAG: acyl-CoA dehydrogenase family protein [Rhodospirillales bacterium]|nr:acyl-CoA dehydrogenase family protein [Alphaproteobacteria bacterium]MBL6928091.1 acyl-CoA dehydrogenase family protein [Rhodospirillales bacterium]